LDSPLKKWLTQGKKVKLMALKGMGKIDYADFCILKVGCLKSSPGDRPGITHPLIGRKHDCTLPYPARVTP
jgi:hypothetical protein